MRYAGYTQTQLEAAFKKVQHPENWKFGNKVWVEEAELDVTCHAIDYFTGGEWEDYETQGTKHLIEFPGYYAVIGA
jgi:hypothetical protein